MVSKGFWTVSSMPWHLFTPVFHGFEGHLPSRFRLRRGAMADGPHDGRVLLQQVEEEGVLHEDLRVHVLSAHGLSSTESGSDMSL